MVVVGIELYGIWDGAAQPQLNTRATGFFVGLDQVHLLIRTGALEEQHQNQGQSGRLGFRMRAGTRGVVLKRGTRDVALHAWSIS